MRTGDRTQENMGSPQGQDRIRDYSWPIAIRKEEEEHQGPEKKICSSSNGYWRTEIAREAEDQCGARFLKLRQVQLSQRNPRSIKVEKPYFTWIGAMGFSRHFMPMLEHSIKMRTSKRINEILHSNASQNYMPRNHVTGWLKWLNIKVSHDHSDHWLSSKSRYLEQVCEWRWIERFDGIIYTHSSVQESFRSPCQSWQAYTLSFLKSKSPTTTDSSHWSIILLGLSWILQWIEQESLNWGLSSNSIRSKSIIEDFQLFPWIPWNSPLKVFLEVQIRTLSICYLQGSTALIHGSPFFNWVVFQIQYYVDKSWYWLLTST